MVCGIEASYILDMLVQYPVIALVLSSASDSCNNQDIVLAPGYNYNLTVSSSKITWTAHHL